MQDFRIALLTDMHVGPTVGRKRVEEIVQLVNQEKPGTVLNLMGVTPENEACLKEFWVEAQETPVVLQSTVIPKKFLESCDVPKHAQILDWRKPAALQPIHLPKLGLTHIFERLKSTVQKWNVIFKISYRFDRYGGWYRWRVFITSSKSDHAV